MPITKVNTPNGIISVNHPKDASEDSILSYAKQEFANQDNLFNKVGDTLEKRAMQLGDIGQAGIYAQPKQQTALETAGQAGLAGIGTAFDVGADVIGSSVNGFGQLAQEAAPETYQAAGDIAKQTGQYLGQQPIVQALGDAVNYVGDQYRELPARAKRNVDALTTATSLYGVGKAREATGALVGDSLVSSAEKSAAAKNQALYQDLVTRKQTQKEINLNPIAEESKWLKEREVVLKEKEKSAAQELNNVPGISNHNSLQANLNAVDKALTTEKTTLDKKLINSKAKIPVADVHARLDDLANKFSTMEGLTDSERSALLEPINIMKQKTLRKNGAISSYDLLKARRELDTSLQVGKSGDLSKSTQAVYEKGLDEVRGTANDILDSVHPGVKASLERQSNLIVAKKNMKTKLKDMPTNRISRVVRKGLDAIPVKGGVAKVGLALGAPVLASLSNAFPPAALAGLAGYGAYKTLTNPLGRKFVGKALGGVSKTAVTAAENAKNAATTEAQQAIKRKALVDAIKFNKEANIAQAEVDAVAQGRKDNLISSIDTRNKIRAPIEATKEMQRQQAIAELMSENPLLFTDSFGKTKAGEAQILNRIKRNKIALEKADTKALMKSVPSQDKTRLK